MERLDSHQSLIRSLHSLVLGFKNTFQKFLDNTRFQPMAWLCPSGRLLNFIDATGKDHLVPMDLACSLEVSFSH